MYDTLWTFKTDRFEVTWSIEPDHEEDLSWDETGEVSAKLETGEYQCFMSKVSVSLDGREIAADYLGGSIYANPADFRDHVGGRGKYGSYFTSMVREAIAGAREELRRNAPPYIRPEIEPAHGQ